MGVKTANHIFSKQLEKSKVMVPIEDFRNGKFVNIYIDALIYAFTMVKVKQSGPTLKSQCNEVFGNLITTLRNMCEYSHIYIVWDGTAPKAKECTQGKRREGSIQYLTYHETMEKIEEVNELLKSLIRPLPNGSTITIKKLDVGEGENWMSKNRGEGHSLLVTSDTDIIPLNYGAGDEENKVFWYNARAGRYSASIYDLTKFKLGIDARAFRYLCATIGTDYTQPIFTMGVCEFILDFFNHTEDEELECRVSKDGKFDLMEKEYAEYLEVPQYEVSKALKDHINRQLSLTFKDAAEALICFSDIVNWMILYKEAPYRKNNFETFWSFSSSHSEVILAEMDWVVEYWTKGIEVDGYFDNRFNGRELHFDGTPTKSLIPTLRQFKKLPPGVFRINRNSSSIVTGIGKNYKIVK